MAQPEWYDTPQHQLVGHANTERKKASNIKKEMTQTQETLLNPCLANMKDEKRHIQRSKQEPHLLSTTCDVFLSPVQEFHELWNQAFFIRENKREWGGGFALRNKKKITIYCVLNTFLLAGPLEAHARLSHQPNVTVMHAFLVVWSRPAVRQMNYCLIMNMFKGLV